MSMYYGIYPEFFCHYNYIFQLLIVEMILQDELILDREITPNMSRSSKYQN